MKHHIIKHRKVKCRNCHRSYNYRCYWLGEHLLEVQSAPAVSHPNSYTNDSKVMRFLGRLVEREKIIAAVPSVLVVFYHHNEPVSVGCFICHCVYIVSFSPSLC